MEEMVFLIEYKDDELWYANLNNAAKDLFGEGFIGKKFKEVLPESSYMKFSEHYLNSIRNKVRVVFTDLNPFLLEKPSSETIITPVVKEDGSCSEAIGITKNIEKLREQHEDYLFMKSFLESTSDAILIIGTDNIVVKANKAFTEMFEWTNEEVIGKHWFDIGIIPVDDIANMKEIKQRMKVLETVPVVETTRLTRSKKEVPVSVSYSPLTNEKGELVAYSMIYRDMTEKIRADEAKKKISVALMQSEAQYRLITENSQDLIKVVSANKTVTYASPSFTHVLGIPHESMIGESMLFGVWEEDLDILMGCHQKLVETLEPTSMEFRYRNHLGEPVWVEVKVTPILEADNILSFISTGRVINERKQLEEKLWHHANHDSLTGLPNRRMLEDVFHASLEKCCDDDMMAILFLDCDKFKQINDTLGHNVGDELLIDLAKRLKAEIRENDVAARLGGDEFVVLLRNIQNKAHVEKVAVRIIETLREPYVLSHHTLNVTSSIGISLYPKHGNTANDLLSHADKALYEVKKEGRNGFRIAE